MAQASVTSSQKEDRSSLAALIVEDSEDDAFLMHRALERDQFEVTARRVDTADELVEALRARPWDVVLSDSAMPALSGAEALQIVRREAPDTPFIIVSGKIGEEQAAAIIKAGADDFVSKQRLKHLPAATRREIEAAELRRRLAERERTLTSLITHLPGFIFRRQRGTDGRTGFEFVSPSVREYMGVEADELAADPDAIWRFVPARDRESALVEIRRSAEAVDTATFEIRVRPSPEDTRWIRVVATPRLDDRANQVWDGFGIDITEEKRAVAALRETSVRLERALAVQTSILDALPANVALLDETGTITAVNRRWRDFGAERAMAWPASAARINYLSVCEEASENGVDEAREAAAGLRALLDRRTPGFTLEYPCHAPEERHWFRMMAAPLADEWGAGAVVMHIDITIEKEAELARRESEARLASLAETVPGFIFRRVVRPDGSGCWAYVSPSFERVLGISPAAIWDTPNAYFERIPQPYRSGLIEEMRAAALEQRETHFEHPIEAWDGKERWLRSTTLPRRLEDGSVEWNGIVLDVTAEKKAATESATLEARLSSIADAVPGWVFRRTVAPDGVARWTYVSNSFERTLGIDLDELFVVSERYFARIPPQYRERFFADMQNAARDLKGHHFEYPVEGGDGATHWIRGSALPHVLSDGTIEWNGIALDITEQKRAEEAFRSAQEQLRGIAGNLPGFLFRRVQRPDGTMRISFVSESIRERYGLDPDTLTANPEAFFDLVHPEDRERVRAYLAQPPAGDTPQTIEYRIVPADGEPRWIRVLAQPHQRADGNIVFDGLGLDVTAEREAEERLNYLAYYDPVTGLPNRALLEDRLGVAMAYATRHGTLLALHYVDLDHFKEVNDTLGHRAGDALLSEVGRRLTDMVRRSDTGARIGGDEFLVVQQDVHEPETAALFAQKILEELKRPFVVEGHRIVVGGSVGIALYPQAEGLSGGGETALDLLKYADVAMYEAKRLGGQAYSFSMAERHALTLHRMELRQALHEALERWEFAFYYQPQVDLATGAIVGAEALIRWERPGVGVVSPADFLPLAEQSGLIVPIGARAMVEAMREAVAWEELTGTPLTVAVNVSGAQLRRDEFAETVRNALAESGLDPSRLELELTETELMIQSQTAIGTLEELSALGISFAVDDFGTGYSSFHYLKTFPIRKLKIDKSFVRDMMNDDRDASIVSAMIMAARGLDLDLVAEGVETEAQRERLLAKDCRNGQGYLFSAPLPADAFRSLLTGK